MMILVAQAVQQAASHWQPDFVHRHPGWVIAALIVYSQAVNAMPAPTAKSSQFYVWFFKFSTALTNILRAYSTKLEASPNWQDAVDKHVENLQGQGNQKPGQN